MKLKNPVNLILLAISFVIFGSLGLIFVTQMEMIPGYSWDSISNRYHGNLELQLTEDLSGDGKSDVIVNSFTREVEVSDLDRASFQVPDFGGIYAIDSQNGFLIWENEGDKPVIGINPIGDIDSDGIEDFFVNMATVNTSWNIRWTEWDGELTEVYSPQIFHNQFSNKLISGKNGTSISESFSNWFISGVVSVNDPDVNDDLEDFIMLEGKYDSLHESYFMNISTYYLNGTRSTSYDIGSQNHPDVFGEQSIPALIPFRYNDFSHALYFNYDSMILFNTSSNDFLEPIYNKTGFNIRKYSFFEDLNLDGVSEIVTIGDSGNINIISGSTGNILHSFTVPLSSDTDMRIYEVGTNPGDQSAVLLITVNDYNNNHFWSEIYSVTISDEERIWEYEMYYEDQDRSSRIYPLGADLTNDGINEIVLIYVHQPLFPTTGENRRFVYIDPTSNQELAVINTERWIRSPVLISDFDGDGLDDLLYKDGLSIFAIATQKPTAIWLSPLFDLGFPVFVILSVLLLLGLVILIFNARKIKPKRERLQASKLAVAVNVIAILLMTISFILFLLQLNIFNRTLIAGDPMTGITNVYLAVTIIWFGLLPLTAAIYNQFAPRFAYGLIMLRSFFFKFSRSYKHAIFVEDLSGRKKLSTTIRLKRVILPILLSISIGFYTYNTLGPLMGYSQSFDTFGTQDFFSFLIGYNLLCLLPMLLTFIAFSFFISGNYMLDDAGIAYYLESKKHRRPGDIEPISIWSQSIIQGIAGFSALITFVSFFQTVDFSGFFTETGGGAAMMFIFGIFLVSVMFYGTPFLTSFSFILLAVEVMDFSYEHNSAKLYKIMEKHGYDTTPRKLTNLFPSGYEELRKSKESLKKKD